MQNKKSNKFDTWINSNIQTENLQARVKKVFKSEGFLRKQTETRFSKNLGKIKLFEDEKEKLIALWKMLRESNTDKKAEKNKNKEIKELDIFEFLKIKNIDNYVKNTIVSNFENLETLRKSKKKDLQIFFDKLELDLLVQDDQSTVEKVLSLRHELIDTKIKTQKKSLNNFKESDSDIFEDFNLKREEQEDEMLQIIEIMDKFVKFLDKKTSENLRISKPPSNLDKLNSHIKFITADQV